MCVLPASPVPVIVYSALISVYPSSTEPRPTSIVPVILPERSSKDSELGRVGVMLNRSIMPLRYRHVHGLLDVGADRFVLQEGRRATH